MDSAAIDAPACKPEDHRGDRRSDREAPQIEGKGGAPGESLADDLAIQRASAMFRAVGDPARLRLVELLSRGEACVTELAEALGDGLSTVSQRLSLLHRERLVTRRRDGKHVYYALDDHHVANLILNALEHAVEIGETADERS